mmetsp:Transcript_15659/g.28512  ORF Transcript_15659/g.28512 Transcript_15659/m.28512 type:complete len:244 (-) Transcript_15659:617-1348(-)
MERLAVYGTLAVVLLVTINYSEVLQYLRLEIIFPARILFHLLSINAGPGARDIRTFLELFLLCFGDLFVTCLLLTEEPPAEIWIMLAQFFLLLTFVHVLKSKGGFEEFRDSYYRVALFLAEAYIQSTSVATAVQVILQRNPFSYLVCSFCIFTVIAKMTTSPLVALAGTFWSGAEDKHQWRELKTEAKKGFFLGLILVGVALTTKLSAEDWFFATNASVAKTVANTYFLMLYSLEAIQYSARH